MRLNLRQVEAFRAVFQTGSMTAAGELMGISQPAVSRLIRDLEAETGLPLFERAGGRVIATPDAVALIREVGTFDEAIATFSSETFDFANEISPGNLQMKSETWLGSRMSIMCWWM